METKKIKSAYKAKAWTKKVEGSDDPLRVVRQKEPPCCDVIQITVKVGSIEEALALVMGKSPSSSVH